MILRNAVVLNRFVRKHRDAGRWLARWTVVVEAAGWTDLTDVRAVFPTADGVRVKVGGGVVIVVKVFNVKGNEYRLLTAIDYASQSVFVVDVLTHADYDKDQWKDRL